MPGSYSPVAAMESGTAAALDATASRAVCWSPMTPGDTSKAPAIIGPAKIAAVALLSAAAGSSLTFALLTRGVSPSPIQRTEPIQQIVTYPAQPATQSPIAITTPDPTPFAQITPAATHQAEPTPAPPPAPPAQVAQQPPPPPPAPVVNTPITPKKINLNTATQAELELLPDIGPKTAIDIIAYRAAHGRFMSVTDLDNVKGIGPKTMAKVAPLVTVD